MLLTKLACQAAPFRTPGSSLSRSRDFAATIRFPAPFHPPRASCEDVLRARLTVTPSDAIRSALLRASVPPIDFCNVDDARTRLRAFDPRPRGGEVPTLAPRSLSRAGVRLLTDGFPRSMSSEPRHPRMRGPRRPSEGEAPLERDVPPHKLLEHPCRRLGFAEGPESPSTLVRVSQDPLLMPPREGRHRLKDRGAFVRLGILTRAVGCPTEHA